MSTFLQYLLLIQKRKKYNKRLQHPGLDKGHSTETKQLFAPDPAQYDTRFNMHHHRHYTQHEHIL